MHHLSTKHWGDGSRWGIVQYLDGLIMRKTRKLLDIANYITLTSMLIMCSISIGNPFWCTLRGSQKNANVALLTNALWMLY